MKMTKEKALAIIDEEIALGKELLDELYEDLRMDDNPEDFLKVPMANFANILLSELRKRMEAEL